jgi:hypothetical protein
MTDRVLRQRHDRIPTSFENPDAPDVHADVTEPALGGPPGYEGLEASRGKG